MGMEHTYFRLHCACGNTGVMDEAVHDAYCGIPQVSISGSFTHKMQTNKPGYYNTALTCDVCGSVNIAQVHFDPAAEAYTKWRTENAPHDAHVFAYHAEIEATVKDIDESRERIAAMVKLIDIKARTVHGMVTRKENQLLALASQVSKIAKRKPSPKNEAETRVINLQIKRETVKLKRYRADQRNLKLLTTI